MMVFDAPMAFADLQDRRCIIALEATARESLLNVLLHVEGGKKAGSFTAKILSVQGDRGIWIEFPDAVNKTKLSSMFIPFSAISGIGVLSDEGEGPYAKRG